MTTCVTRPETTKTTPEDNNLESQFQMCINVYLGLFAGLCCYGLHGFGIDLTGEMGD